VPTSKGGREGMGKGKEGDGKREGRMGRGGREGEGGKGRGGRARHECAPINKKKITTTPLPLTRGSTPGPRWGLRSPTPHHSEEIAATE